MINYDIIRMKKAEAEANPQLVLHYFERAAQEGDVQAQLELSRIFEAGEIVAKDDARAIELETQAVNANYAPALAARARRLFIGNGVVIDIPDAIRLFRNAAASGETGAMFDLARAYHKGDGVTKSAARAGLLMLVFIDLPEATTAQRAEASILIGELWMKAEKNLERITYKFGDGSVLFGARNDPAHLTIVDKIAPWEPPGRFGRGAVNSAQP